MNEIDEKLSIIENKVDNFVKELNALYETSSKLENLARFEIRQYAIALYKETFSSSDTMYKLAMHDALRKLVEFFPNCFSEEDKEKFCS